LIVAGVRRCEVTRCLHECEWSMNVALGQRHSIRPVKSGLVAAGGCESKCKKRFLLQLMGLGRARGGAGAPRALDRADAQAAGLREAFQPRQNVEMRAHVGGLFLNPDDFAGVRMFSDRSGNLSAWQRIELVEEEDGRAGVFAASAFSAQLVADFAAGDQDALGI